ncbi:MAG TPA: Npt1/Npt2 family nucleotide transporter [Myxococcaceae bacterium]|nr:Npt1/Npt2 family nucleotide transporter [Myxococcaceae bacterium]
MSAEPRALAWPERLLRPFAEVRAGEAMTALVLTATIFLILTAYYLLKVIREPLILLSGGAEVKAYAAAGQALLLIPVLRAHGAIARRVSRLKLIAIIFLFVASNLLVFAALFRASVPIGLSFYLWVGTFNYLLVATFWSFANDVYTPEQGKRLFAIIGVGSSVGALAGAALASFLLKKLGPLELMLASAALLVVTLVPFALVNGQQRCCPKDRGREMPKDQPLTGEGGFHALIADRYLLLIGFITVLANWVTNSGEYVLDKTLIEAARSSALADPGKFVGQFKAEYFWWVNLVAVIGQFFVVSRVLKYLGVGSALLILPVVSMGGAVAIVLFPALALIRVAKVAEKGVEYSLETTAVNALYLVVSRDEKYKAKAVIDTFLVRAGDVCAAASIWIGTHLGVRTSGFAALNVVLTATWLFTAWRVRSLHLVRSGAIESRPLTAATAAPSA